MKELPVVLDLPVALHREIGRVITGYSYLEYLLSRITYDLLDVGPKQGRIAIREPRGPDRLEMIFDLANLAKIPFQTDKQLLRDAITACTSQRDQLGHGVWLRDPKTKTLFLRITAGSWQPVKGQRGKTKRKVSPQGLEYGAEDCRLLRQIIDETISLADGFGKEIRRGLSALRETSP